MAKPQPDFALDELVGALEELTKEEGDSQGFFTTTEICEKMGCGREKARDLLRKAREEGRLTVGTKKIWFLDNRMSDVTAYKIEPKEEKNEGVLQE